MARVLAVPGALARVLAVPGALAHVLVAPDASAQACGCQCKALACVPACVLAYALACVLACVLAYALARGAFFLDVRASDVRA